MVPLSAVATFRYGSGPVQVTRYNNYPAAEIQGQTPPGVASGDSLRTMEELAAKNLSRWRCCACSWCWPRNMNR